MGLHSISDTPISYSQSFEPSRNKPYHTLHSSGSCCPALVPCAVRHIEKLYYGNLEPHLLQGCDGFLYVTKFQNNPKHVRVLASEFLATRIGLWLGLPMAVAGAISVSDSFVASNPGLHIEIEKGVFIPCSSGLQLASRYVGHPASNTDFQHWPRTKLHRIRNLSDFIQVLAFDKWAGNCDGRQAVASLRSARPATYTVTFLDQHWCFNGPEWTFLDYSHMGLCDKNSVYNSVVGLESFEPMLSRIASIEQVEIWKLAADIPGEWYEQDSSGLCRLIDTLYQRRRSIGLLLTELRDSRFNPFRNWTARSM